MNHCGHRAAPGHPVSAEPAGLPDRHRREDLWLLDPARIHPNGEWTPYEFAPEYGETEEYPSFAELFHASKEQMTRLAENES